MLLSAGSLQAEDTVLQRMFGNGVHAYFSGDYVKAHEHLTSAIDGGTADPRCYYYRGLAYIRLGREPEARIDFAKGARLETRDLDGFYNVSRSLERIQGRTRLLLEQNRSKARMAALKQAAAVHRARYQATREEESRVLYQPSTAAPGRASPPLVQPLPEEGIFEPGAPQPPTENGNQPSTDPTGPLDPADAHVPPAEPAPEANGQDKPSGVFRALRNAIVKAIVGEGGPEAPGILDIQGDGQTQPMTPEEFKKLLGLGAEQPGTETPPIETPHHPPIETPHQPPAEMPTETPEGDPFADGPPIETPHHPSAETPADTPEEAPGADEPSAEPPAETPAETPTDTPEGDPFADEPTDEPTDEPMPEPTAEPPGGDPFAG